MFSSLRSSTACRGPTPPNPGSAAASLPPVGSAEASPVAPLPAVEGAPPADRKGRVGRARGGRPRAADPRRPRGIRFSAAEWAAIEARAAAAGRDPHEFVRVCALGRRLAAVPEADRERWSRLAPLAANLNQLAGAVNAGRVAEAMVEVQALRRALLGLDGDALPADREGVP